MSGITLGRTLTPGRRDAVEVTARPMCQGSSRHFRRGCPVRVGQNCRAALGGSASAVGYDGGRAGRGDAGPGAGLRPDLHVSTGFSDASDDAVMQPEPLIDLGRVEPDAVISHDDFDRSFRCAAEGYGCLRAGRVLGDVVEQLADCISHSRQRGSSNRVAALRGFGGFEVHDFDRQVWEFPGHAA